MTFRRITFRSVLCAVIIAVVCLHLSAAAAPPQFRAAWPARPSQFSPFPGFRPAFMSSITPTEYIPLTSIQSGQAYLFDYDYPEYAITYTRSINDRVRLIPVTSDYDVFVSRRLEMSQANLASGISKGSLAKEQKKKAGGLFQITIPIPSRTFESIFGEGGAGLRVSGYRKISFTGRSSWTDNEQTATYRQSKFPTLQMEQDYRFEIEGTIGSKISVKVNQDSRNDIPLANRLILRYRGTEDDVLQTVEAGNTMLNLPSTQFLGFSSRVQGLFGIKATARVADLEVTAIASQEKGSTESVEVSSGTSAKSTIIKRDIDYAKNTIFDLGRKDSVMVDRAKSDTLDPPDKIDFAKGDSIITAVVYIDDINRNQTERLSGSRANCYIDPEDSLSDDPRGEYWYSGYFEVMPEGEYTFDPIDFYVIFMRSIPRDAVVAVYMEVYRKSTGTVEIIGDNTGEPYRLKLIKPQRYFRPNRHIWEYQWRNVYWLGAYNLDPRNIEVQIYHGSPKGNNQEVDNSNPTEQGGVQYLEILGLDAGNDLGTGNPDGEIDRQLYIDPFLGLLYFPSRHPFDSRAVFAFAADSTPIILADSVPEIYVNAQELTTSQSSRYYLAITTRGSGSAVIDLNAFNIIEGSEVIKYGNTRLSRDVDYKINYTSGQVTLLKDEYTDLGSNLSITYEKAPFFSLARKTLLGTRVEYAPRPELRLGSTILYKSEKSTSRKPKVGEETSKMFVWDVDFYYKFENPLLTTLANAFPLMSATAKSYMQVSGEVAQSRPNPNVDGEVFIDDFEGAKDSYSLGVLRLNWRHASRPAVLDSLPAERGYIAWYNPFDQVPIEEVWNRDIGTGESRTTHVLSIRYRPVDFIRVADTVNNLIDTTSTPLEPERSWGGFMRNIPIGASVELQHSQLLEMRVRGDRGIIHIDLGRISEDINGDGKTNNEDKDGYRILTDDEDLGLDGLPDSLEFGYDPANGIHDPSRDNFDYNDIWRINGTQGNGDDQGGGGYYPDTEDPNYNGLETSNDYFSYRIDLSDTTDYLNGFYVEDSRNKYNWRTIRIPLRDPAAVDTIVGEASWENIWFARLWIDSAGVENKTDPIAVDIASIELLSTVWADSFYIADSLRSGQASFDVAVINDEVNENYRPPPGVEGHYDQAREAIENEQSLLLVFDSLNAAVPVYSPDSGIVLAADTGLAVRKFIRTSNFMGYGRLQAYVYGNVKESDSVRFFFRVGADEDAYYEFRTTLKSGVSGWDPANYVVIDFAEITGLKARLLADRTRGVDSSLTRVDESGRNLVKIKRQGVDPTLTNISYFAMGVVNLDSAHAASGEIWVDELRLTDVRDDVGMAARVSISGNISDLISSYNFSYSSEDAYYRRVSSATKGGGAQNLGSGQTSKQYSFSAQTNLNKFVPRSLEMDMPVGVNWSQRVQEPLLRSGTDIVVPQELKSIETIVSISRGFRISESFNKKTRNPLFTLLLNRLTTKFNYNISKGHSPQQPMSVSERYDVNASFNMSMKNVPSISPFTWARLFRVPFGLPKTKLYLYPTRLDFSGTLNSTYSRSINQNSANPTTAKLDFRGNMNMAFKIFENLKGSYSFSTLRDLRDPATINLVLNPKEFKLGVEQNYSQNFSADYTPSLFKFLTHSFDYSATYTDTYRSGLNSQFFHSANTKVTQGVSFGLKHQVLIGSNKPSGSSAPRRADTTSSVFDVFGYVLKGIRYITDAIKPVSGKYGISRSLNLPGLADKAAIPFRFGLTEDPGVEEVSATTTTNRLSKSISTSFSANSGVSLFAGITTDVSYARSVNETFFPTPSKTLSVDWPDLKFNLRSVRGLWYLGKIINALSPSSRYTRSKDTKWRKGSAIPWEATVNEAFSPILSFTLTPLRSMRTQANFRKSTTTTTTFSEKSGETIRKRRQGTTAMSFTWSYSFSNPTGFKLPLLGRLKFESNLKVSVDVSINKTKGENADAESGFAYVLSDEKTSLTISPSASYSFSRTVTGSLQGKWQDSTNAQTRRNQHTRELRILVELHF